MTHTQQRAAQLESLVDRATRQAERRCTRCANFLARWQRKLEECIESLLERQAQAWRPLTYEEARFQCEQLLREKDRRMRVSIAIADGQAAWHQRILNERYPYYDDEAYTATGVPRGIFLEAPISAPNGGPPPDAPASGCTSSAAPASSSGRHEAGARPGQQAWLEVCIAALMVSGVSFVEARQLCEEAGRGSLTAIRRIQLLTGHGPWVHGHAPAPAGTAEPARAPTAA